MGLIVKILLGILIFIILLVIVYFFLLAKLKKINIKIFKYKEEVNLKEQNVCIVYQPSRHQTTYKIAQKIKDNVVIKGYGYCIQTLSNNDANYTSFKYVVFVMPVYFGEVHTTFINILSNENIKNLIIIYNGLNENNNEDINVKKISLSKYKKIKTHTNDIEILDDFISKEVF